MAASRVRARVLVFAFLLAVVTYLDRICIAAAAPYIMADLRLSVLQMSVVFSAFTLSYSLFEIPSGWLADVVGPRRVLTRIVLWWSAFTTATAAGRGFQSLVAIRFLFGAGEAGAFPNVARAFAAWFPTSERGRANGVLFFGSRVGGMLAAPVALLIVSRWGWRTSFVLFGATGVVWAVAWFAWYRDRPEQHPAVNAEELAWIRQDRHNGERPAERERTPWARAAAQPQPVRHLLHVFFLQLRPVFLFHLAADVPDQGTRAVRRGESSAGVAAFRARLASRIWQVDGSPTICPARAAFASAVAILASLRS